MTGKRCSQMQRRQNALRSDDDNDRDDDELLMEVNIQKASGARWSRRSIDHDRSVGIPLYSQMNPLPPQPPRRRANSRLSENSVDSDKSPDPVDYRPRHLRRVSSPNIAPMTCIAVVEPDSIVPDVPHVFMPELKSQNNGQALRKLSDTIVAPPRHSLSSFFSDGKRRIDFVLVYEKNTDESKSSNVPYLPNSDRGGSPQRHSDKRALFELNLQRLGLELEYASGMHSNTQFVLIHAPFHVLLKQAELMNIKMPVYQNDIKKQANLMDGALNAFLRRFRFLDFDERVKRRIEPLDYFTQPFIEQHLECFVNHKNQQTFFSSSDRSRMVYDFLIRTRYDSGRKDKFRFSIDRLVKSQTYTAAYPLHDNLKFSKPTDFTKCTDRELLYETWVRPKNIWKYQPLHLIKDYFGTKIGLYFAWLGYYTRFLYSVSVLGIICVIYGIVTMGDDIPSNDVCADDGIGAKVLLCPVCEKNCDFTSLKNSCRYSMITYVFDNGATVVFAIIMSIWTTLFLEGWKRYHAELAYKWNVLDYETEQEVMRPEFQYLKGSLRTNPVTQQKEPYIPFRTRAIRFAASFVVVLFFMLLIVALVTGIVVYRIILMHVFYTIDSEDENILRAQAVLITSGTAAVINLIFILLMNYIYDILALKLTELECHRTQTEFDNSYTLKVFLFQFVNFYSSLFYIAFIKGKFSGVPAYIRTDIEGTGVRVFGQRLEDCDPAGCMVELVIQLCIIMVGKQMFNAFTEIGYPVIDHWIRRWRLRLPSSNLSKNARSKSKLEARQQSKSFVRDGVTPLYECDYSLSPVSQQFLFNEYLEMVLQFGFITLFVAAFPLAPLFALLNNILEIRLDAYKFVVTTRRPIPAQAKNIGVWITILDLLSNVAVLCNAFVIAFTSDFIPKLYYRLTHGGVMYGYVNDSLSYFDASGYTIKSSDFVNVTECRYRDYRKPPCELGLLDSHGECSHYGGYEFQDKWWIILTMRLTFVLVFELFVLSIKAIFAYMIPDVPSEITIQLQREKYLARQAILQRSDAAKMNQRRHSTPDSSSTEVLTCNYDTSDVAFQLDDDIVGDDNAGNGADRQQNNFRRMFLNRRVPSISPQPPRRIATVAIDKLKDPSNSGCSQSFASTTSLSPDAAWMVGIPSALLQIQKTDRSEAKKPPTEKPSNCVLPIHVSVLDIVTAPIDTNSSAQSRAQRLAAAIDSSNESFHTAHDKNSTKNFDGFYSI